MKRPVPPISIAGSQLGDVRHICAFFNSEEEEYRVLLPFIQDGFRCGDKAIHVVNPDQTPRHLDRLRTAEINVSAARDCGQLEIHTSTDTYLSDGIFDQDRMLESFERMASGHAAGSYPLSRIVCRMDWASNDPSHTADLIEFESRVNDLWCQHDDAVICTYHLSKFGGATVIDIMRTHPLVIVGGVLHQNPFYLPPEAFLREYRGRRARQMSSRSSSSAA
ncbi:conserved hypothetical protein [Candidatus Koribacter versatilis Ellin345]|uniref:MEDS domain-containing protein n=1 Tax=Koribacter versatilis (strain Ellin345) TaxID=204669 RepID=Q1ITF3_KORVE|nr:MEDS domain-containing protein [Candidatus Koribacter versatilis]ABF39847.1 conserved hypothetical protein [Candidatus Koribacter versatilis Ellin345]